MIWEFRRELGVSKFIEGTHFNVLCGIGNIVTTLIRGALKNRA